MLLTKNIRKDLHTRFSDICYEPRRRPHRHAAHKIVSRPATGTAQGESAGEQAAAGGCAARELSTGVGGRHDAGATRWREATRHASRLRRGRTWRAAWRTRRTARGRRRVARGRSGVPTGGCVGEQAVPMVHATGSTAQGQRAGGSLRGTGAGCSDGARSGRHATGGGWHGVVAVCLRDVVRASRLLRRRTRRATVHHATRHASGWCAGQEQDARTSVAKREQLAAVPAACAAARLYGLARQARKAGGGRK